MTANSFGSIFHITSFGESHGKALGVIIEGCPAGIPFDFELLQQWMQRRRPGLGTLVSARNEADEMHVLSGVFEGKTLGTPIAMLVHNTDTRSEDYQQIKISPRLGHADDVWRAKFGHVDHRGGGRSSGRETVSRVMAAAVAEMLVKKLAPEVSVRGNLTQVGPLHLPQDEAKLEQLLTKAKEEGESFGGVVEVLVSALPVGLGQPVFHKLKSDFAAAVMSVGATTSFEFGDGVEAGGQKGTAFHDAKTTAQYGGIRGGLSTGEPISMRISFKPTSSILDVAKKGRHDPCIAIRGLPVVEAMVWLVLADHLLWRRLDCVSG